MANTTAATGARRDVLALEIVTPTGVAVSRDVTEVDVPTIDGEIGVLPGHVTMLTAVRTGLVTARPVGGNDVEPIHFAVAHGVLEITGEKAVLLTEKLIRKEDVDTVAVRARFKAVDEELHRWEGEVNDPARHALIEEEQWLAAQLELIGDPPPPMVRELTRFQSKGGDEVIIEAEGVEGSVPAGPADAQSVGSGSAGGPPRT